MITNSKIGARTSRARCKWTRSPQGRYFSPRFSRRASAYAKLRSTRAGRAGAGCRTARGYIRTRKLLHRHDGRDGVQELPSSGHREEDSDFMLMKTYAKLWKLPTYCDYYYVHVLRPPFYRRRRDVGECSRLPVSGSLIFRWRSI